MAHVHYGDEVSAQAAQKNLNGAQFLSNKLIVEFAPEETEYKAYVPEKTKYKIIAKPVKEALRAIPKAEAPIAQLVEAQ